MKVAVYTAMTGDYDNVQPPHYVDEEFDYYFLTDNKNLEVPRPYTKIVRDWSEPRGDKLEKILIPKEIRDNYDYCIWHDASMIQLSSLSWLIRDMNKGWAIPVHKSRSCITEELQAVAYYKKENLDKVNAQVQRYLNNEMPLGYGVWEAGLMIRDCKDQKVLDICHHWWEEYLIGSMRDQLSLPYVFWMFDFKPNMIPRSATRGVYYTIQQHKG